jgi:Protein of unknwon function (DUF3310)
MVQGRETVSNFDNINPNHYQRGNIEAIEVIEVMVSGWPPETAYRLGNVLKYLWRHRQKGGVESLRKAQWYLQREIEALADFEET